MKKTKKTKKTKIKFPIITPDGRRFETDFYKLDERGFSKAYRCFIPGVYEYLGNVRADFEKDGGDRFKSECDKAYYTARDRDVDGLVPLYHNHQPIGNLWRYGYEAAQNIWQDRREIFYGYSKYVDEIYSLPKDLDRIDFEKDYKVPKEKLDEVYGQITKQRFKHPDSWQYDIRVEEEKIRTLEELKRLSSADWKPKTLKPWLLWIEKASRAG